DILALDGTARERPDGLSFAETLRRVREESDVPVMADCDSVESAVAAAEAGGTSWAPPLPGTPGHGRRLRGRTWNCSPRWCARCRRRPWWPKGGSTPPSRPGRRPRPARSRWWSAPPSPIRAPSPAGSTPPCAADRRESDGHTAEACVYAKLRRYDRRFAGSLRR